MRYTALLILAVLALALLTEAGRPSRRPGTSKAAKKTSKGATAPSVKNRPVDARLFGFGVNDFFHDDTEWPSTPFGTLRLWDSNTTWRNLEPVKGQWDWTNLDKYINKARATGVRDILYVFGGTPEWAACSMNPNDAAWMGSGSAAPAKDINDFARYVETVVRKYKGVITSYECLNEPNLPMFWRGTPQMAARYQQIVYQTVKRIDPRAKVVLGSLSFRTPGQTVAAARRWWAPMRAFKFPFDVVGVHTYPKPGLNPKGFVDIVAASRSVMKSLGMGPKPVWVTEINFNLMASDNPLPNDVTDRYVRRTMAEAMRIDVPRIIWYAWSNQPTILGLFFRNGSAATTALASSYQNMVGSTFEGCREAAGRTVCKFNKGGQRNTVQWTQ